MELLLLIIRLILAAIFATAGITKFADLKGSEKAFKEFGVPSSIALPSSILLSAAEALIAVLFLFPSVSWYAAIGATALLAIFIAQMVYQRAMGNAPDCHCFGQLHSEPVSIKSIARNIVFLALAVLPLYRGRFGQGLALSQISQDMMPTILGTLAVIMIGGALLYLRKIADAQDEFRRRLDVLELVSREGATVDHEHATDPVAGLPIGAPLPEFGLTTLDGTKASSRAVVTDTGLPTLFLFVSPTCGPCQALLPDVIKWREELKNRVAFAFVTSGSEKGNRKKFADVADSPILLDDERQFANAVGGKWTPTALFVDANGRVASHIAAADTAIEELVERIKTADLASPVLNFSNGSDSGRSKIGTVAPEFSLTDVRGREITKDDLKGKPTLVTFWSTTCPHCNTFLDEFKGWEHSRNNDDPNLILFSDGDEAEHRDLGFDSPVVLDKGYKIAAKLGMFGTPSAVLVNEEGVITTETAVGAENILALIGKRRNGSD
jgi:thiol-disulfide isomerase/thioredoxin/uncharacterized membrane protein YphA (DoxX/SURF4 family)